MLPATVHTACNEKHLTANLINKLAILLDFFSYGTILSVEVGYVAYGIE